ncbi:hypothetical protein OJ253_1686 [Cryptosporidium canis]|uniref:Signal peptide-containing protein n=1 Tax=Cryptosporidium canis TaxID=195482 RepID=A0A9D5DIW6_9CRYT|nr:hypothetical protein OJ253_1686 [Cryptosporidium canis]
MRCIILVLLVLYLRFGGPFNISRWDKLGLSTWMNVSVNLVDKVSLSVIGRSIGLGRGQYSGFLLNANDLDPDEIFALFESNGEQWLSELSKSDLEDILDKLRFLLNLQVSEHERLVVEQSEEAGLRVKKSTDFINLLLKYILMLIRQLVEKMKAKFEQDSVQICGSESYIELEQHQRGLHFLVELKDLVRNLYFILHCKNPLVKGSPLCDYLTNLYSDTECDFLAKSEFLSEVYARYESSLVSCEDSPSSGPKKTKKRSRRSRYKHKNKAKMVVIRKKSRAKTKRRVHFDV